MFQNAVKILQFLEKQKRILQTQRSGDSLLGAAS